MQNLKHVNIKVQREFRDTIPCLAFNTPQLHLLVKLLPPTTHLMYLRGKKEGSEEGRYLCGHFNWYAMYKKLISGHYYYNHYYLMYQG